MTEHQKNFPEFYVTAPQSCPYLPGRRERKLFTHLTHDKPLSVVDSLLKGGFRRSQNIAYMPHCDGCQQCVSVRVVVEEFHPSRSFRRIIDDNRDLAVRRLPPVPTSEQYGLFRSYIADRHGDGGMADMTVLDFAMMIEDSVLETCVSEFRLRPPGSLELRPERWPLVAVSLCDRLSDGVSMVYSFFDPAHSHRSLGTWMILDQIERTRMMGLDYLYLGYWVQGSRKMAYKARFGPQERLGPDGWSRVEG